MGLDGESQPEVVGVGVGECFDGVAKGGWSIEGFLGFCGWVAIGSGSIGNDLLKEAYI